MNLPPGMDVAIVEVLGGIIGSLIMVGVPWLAGRFGNNVNSMRTMQEFMDTAIKDIADLKRENRELRNMIDEKTDPIRVQVDIMDPSERQPSKVFVHVTRLPRVSKKDAGANASPG